MLSFKQKVKINVLSSLVYFLFRILHYLLKFKIIDYPKEPQFLLALWHAHQCAVHSVNKKNTLNIMISPSIDGQIIANVCEKMGYKTVRGSKGRGGSKATLQMLERLEQGENGAIMVDGPRGPRHHVHNGVIKISKISQVPIIPMVWYSKDKTFLKFNSWDEFRIPMGPCRTVVKFGEPIYIPADADDEQQENYRQNLEETLKVMYEDLVENYDSYKSL